MKLASFLMAFSIGTSLTCAAAMSETGKNEVVETPAAPEDNILCNHLFSYQLGRFLPSHFQYFYQVFNYHRNYFR